MLPVDLPPPGPMTDAQAVQVVSGIILLVAGLGLGVWTWLHR